MENTQNLLLMNEKGHLISNVAIDFETDIMKVFNKFLKDKRVVDAGQVQLLAVLGRICSSMLGVAQIQPALKWNSDKA
jgi:hypothetical protein